jgi:hypothetical protein
LELPRSTIRRAAPARRISAWFRDALVSGMTMSLSGDRPILTTSGAAGGGGTGAGPSVGEPAGADDGPMVGLGPAAP